MANEIISYIEMCHREGLSLQRGMNFRQGTRDSVILMSVRKGAPYRDRLEEGGSVLIYEGHDHSKGSRIPNPKAVDQPERTPSGRLTENGKFFMAAQNHKEKGFHAERVRVYEKVRDGIWSYNGTFDLLDAWKEHDGFRVVFRFKLIAIDETSRERMAENADAARRRIIPTQVKLAVWKRDGGKCVLCGAANELHFDHDLPYSKGGTSLLAENVRLLCARHNLQKHNRIE